MWLFLQGKSKGQQTRVFSALCQILIHLGSTKKAAGKFLSPPHIRCCCDSTLQAKGFPSPFPEQRLSDAPSSIRSTLWPVLNTNETWQRAEWFIHTRERRGILLPRKDPVYLLHNGLCRKAGLGEYGTLEYSCLLRLYFQEGWIYLSERKLYLQHWILCLCSLGRWEEVQDLSLKYKQTKKTPSWKVKIMGSKEDVNNCQIEKFYVEEETYSMFLCHHLYGQWEVSSL